MAVMKLGNLDPVPAPFAYLVDTDAGTDLQTLQTGEGAAQIMKGTIDPELHGQALEPPAEIEPVPVAFRTKFLAGDHLRTAQPVNFQERVKLFTHRNGARFTVLGLPLVRNLDMDQTILQIEPTGLAATTSPNLNPS
jgi:hypothetical protein